MFRLLPILLLVSCYGLVQPTSTVDDNDSGFEMIDIDAVVNSIMSTSNPSINGIVSKIIRDAPTEGPYKKKDLEILEKPLHDLILGHNNTLNYEDDMKQIATEKILVQSLLSMQREDYNKFVILATGLLESTSIDTDHEDVIKSAYETLSKVLTTVKETTKVLNGETTIDGQSETHDTISIDGHDSTLEINQEINKKLSEDKIVSSGGGDDGFPDEETPSAVIDDFMAIKLIDFASQLPILQVLKYKNNVESTAIKIAVEKPAVAVATTAGRFIGSILPNITPPGLIDEDSHTTEDPLSLFLNAGPSLNEFELEDIISPILPTEYVTDVVNEILDSGIMAPFSSAFRSKPEEETTSALQFLLVDRLTASSPDKNKLMLLEYLTKQDDTNLVSAVLADLAESQIPFSDETADFVNRILDVYSRLLDFTAASVTDFPLSVFSSKLQEVLLSPYAEDYCNYYDCTGDDA